MNNKDVVSQHNHKLSLRLVLATMMLSLLTAIIVSTIQIYIAYQQSIESAKDRFTQIEMGYLPSLEAGLWEANGERVNALLDSIAQLPDVGKVVLSDEQQQLFIRNQDSFNTFAEKDMALRYRENNSNFPLGNLHVELTSNTILAQLKARAISIAITTLLTLFIGSLIVLLLFQRWVSRHLHTMAEFAKQIDLTKLDSRLNLERSNSHRGDELDIVVESLNNMQLSLKNELNLRAEAEQELRAHKENLENLVNTRTRELKSSISQLGIASEIAELGVWTWNITTNKLEWNERMFNIYAQPLSLRNNLKYEHWLERIHPDDVEATNASFIATIGGHGVLKPVFRILTPGGETRYIQAGAKVERDSSGNAMKVIGINRDISLQMELEANLTRAKEQADTANAAKSAFLANISHEIRTPMNAILGMLQLVQQTELSARQKDYLNKTHTAAKSLLGLLNDILDFSKNDAGKLQLDNHPFAIESLMCGLGVVLSGNQRGNNIEIIFDMDPLLPATLIGDQLRLQQVLINLAGNALKFTLQGHVLISLTTLASSPGSTTLRIAVADTGIGISPEQKQRLFDRFVQAEASTTRRFGGTGLGLVISQRLVSVLGGELQVESELDRGSRFWFDLTLATLPGAELAQPQSPADISQLSILVADDNPLTCEVLARTISILGARVETVNTLALAREKIASAELTNLAYDVVLLDLYMGESHGTSAVNLIQQTPCKKAPAIIMLAAFGREEFREQLNSDIHVLTKPFTPQQMVESLLNATLGVSKVATSQPTASRHHPLANLNLLVVEDNELNRQVAYELLKSQGAKVTLAKGGLEGVAIVLHSDIRFDVVIMDLQMPDIDGIEATHRIRSDSRFSQLPILAMTANASLSDRDKCLIAGMTEHIGKPIDLAELVPCILALASKH